MPNQIGQCYSYVIAALRLGRRILPFVSLIGNATAQMPIHTAAQTDTTPKYIARSNSPSAPIDGLCIDIDRALEHLDSKLHFVGDQSWMPASRVDAELNAGDLDVACGISKTAVRQKTLYFAEPPLFYTEYVLVARNDDQVNIRNWDDVRALGERGVILADHGFGLVSYLALQGGLRIDDGTTGVKSNLLKLRAGRGRFYYHRLLGLVDDIKHADMLADVRILPVVLDRQPFYMVFGPHAPKEAIDRTQQAIAELARNGELTKMLQKWSTPADKLQGLRKP
ncbi:MAG TPA: transporter substrate-binding domain-containing protein [Burkholderiaceae bacterium]|nr:transporter substrate-binding domain-containing protein [Burkholderiaceae bacterium]